LQFLVRSSFPKGGGNSITKQIKSSTSIHPVALGSYSYQASNKIETSSPAIFPEFYYLAFSRPSITAATDKFMISQEIITVKERKYIVEKLFPHPLGEKLFLSYVS